MIQPEEDKQKEGSSPRERGARSLHGVLLAEMGIIPE